MSNHKQLEGQHLDTQSKDEELRKQILEAMGYKYYSIKKGSFYTSPLEDKVNTFIKMFKAYGNEERLKETELIDPIQTIALLTRNDKGERVYLNRRQAELKAAIEKEGK